MLRTALALLLALGSAADDTARTLARAHAAEQRLDERVKQLTGTLPPAQQPLFATAQQRWAEARKAELAFEARVLVDDIPPAVRDAIGMETTARARLQELDAEAPTPDATAAHDLQHGYDELKAELRAPEVPLLVAAQEAWTRYRDAELAFETARHPARRAACLDQLNRARQLRLLYVDNGLGGLP